MNFEHILKYLKTVKKRLHLTNIKIFKPDQYYLKKYNLSYQQLLNNVRYELASELLSESEQPIYAISALVGFSDSTVFSKGFKKYIGETPSKYRKYHKTLKNYNI